MCALSSQMDSTHPTIANPTIIGFTLLTRGVSTTNRVVATSKRDAPAAGISEELRFSQKLVCPALAEGNPFEQAPALYQRWDNIPTIVLRSTVAWVQADLHPAQSQHASQVVINHTRQTYHTNPDRQVRSTSVAVLNHCHGGTYLFLAHPISQYTERGFDG